MKSGLLLLLAVLTLHGGARAALLPCSITDDNAPAGVAVIGIVRKPTQQTAMKDHETVMRQTLKRIIDKVGRVRRPGDDNLPKSIVCVDTDYQMDNLEANVELHREKRIVLVLEVELGQRVAHTLRYAMIYGYKFNPAYNRAIEATVEPELLPGTSGETLGATELKRVLELEDNERTARGLIQLALGLTYLRPPANQVLARHWLCQAKLALKDTAVMREADLEGPLGNWLLTASGNDADKVKLCGSN